MSDLRARSLSIVGAALVLMFYSELFFLNDGPTKTVTDILTRPSAAAVELLELTTYYAFFAWGLLLVLPYAERLGLAGIILAGCIFGWVTEGTIIPIVYEAPPISWVWPSISWHAMVDVLLGLFIVRFAMRRLGCVALALLFTTMGIAWGVWATWTWGEPTMPRLSPAVFLFFACTSAAIWLGGMALLDRSGPWQATRPEKWGIAGVTVALGLLMATAGLPFSVGIMVIAGATWWLLVRKSERLSESDWRLPSGPVRLTTYGLTLIVPATASVTYWLVWTNGWHIPIEEVAGLAMIAGALVFFWAIWRAFTTR
ncbi:hypothetical protein MUY35_12810 [Aliiroseovarius sp. S1339]|uniref:hypothetical protein n=1 Tax=Aliiroseovarius sp. S1339 TaxID=2936990 RepID=UPI0020BDB5F8|nr:hypothetical protein [Aliiroseovarius sp. S1339]MCK8464730.1 hypothetical protein [Aliiroseovarius sp. S1339]